MASKKVLGRGLGAFFPEYDEEESQSKKKKGGEGVKEEE